MINLFSKRNRTAQQPAKRRPVAGGILEAVFGPSQPVSATNHWISNAGGGPTVSGISVNEGNAMHLVAVYAAIGIIADSIAAMPIHVYQTVNGNGERRPDHPAQWILKNEPNPNQTAFIQQQTAQSHCLGWGNGYLEIVRNNRGEIHQLWPLLPDRTRGKKDTNGRLSYDTNIDGQVHNLPAANVLHVPAMGFDGLCGYSPIHVAREAIGLGLAAQEFGASFFGQGAGGGGFLEHPAALSDTAYARLEKFADSQGGLSQANRLRILEEGMSFNTNTVPPEEAQFIETREMQIGEIARLYRVPLHLLQSKEGTSNWGTGIESLGIAFVTYTLAPWLIRWEQELDRKIFTAAERAAGYYVKYNTDALVRGDLKARSEFYAKAVGRPWMSVDQARALEDMPPAGITEIALPLNTADKTPPEDKES